MRWISTIKFYRALEKEIEGDTKWKKIFYVHQLVEFNITRMLT